MATITLKQEGTGNANMQIQLTYTAGAGAISITAIKGRRTDAYDTLGSSSSNRVHIKIGDKTFTLTPSASDSYYIRFTKNSVWSAAWAGVSASRDDVQGNQDIEITFTCPPTANIANSKFTTTINAGYKAPSMSIANTAKSLNSATFKCTYSNATPEKIQIYNETTKAVAYEGTSLTPTITGLTKNTTYKFKVRGYANSTWGDYSNSISVTTNKGAILDNTTYSITNESPKVTPTYSNDLTSSTVKYSLTDSNGIINISGTATTTSIALELTSTQVTNLLKANPTLSKIPLSLVLTTNNIETSTATINLNVVNSNPGIAEPYYEDVNESTKAMTGDFFKVIAKHSEVQLIIYTMEPKNGAEEGSYNVLVDNVNVFSIKGTGAATYTAKVGTIPSEKSVIQLEAIDSRGLSSKINVPLEIYGYEDPVVSSAKASRQNLVEEATTITAEGTYRYYPSFTSTNSIVSAKYRYRVDEDTISWSDYKDISGVTSDEGKWYINGIGIDGDTDLGFDVEKAYLIELVLYDELGGAVATITLNSSNPSLWLDRKNKFLGIGKKPEEALDVKGNVKITGNYYLSSGNAILDYETVDEW